MGVKLFARQGKKMQLTEAGRSLCNQADYLLNYVATLQQHMADLVGSEAGHVRLGAVEPTASLRLPPLLVEFCNACPKVRLSLEVSGTQGISSRVADGALDLGICPPPAAQPALLFEPLFGVAFRPQADCFAAAQRDRSARGGGGGSEAAYWPGVSPRQHHARARGRKPAHPLARTPCQEVRFP